MATNKNGAVMEETFLSRFDALDVRVRKVLQTCAVLGLSFDLSDVIRVHPEMEEGDIEDALESAVDEMILIEQVEHEENETLSMKSGSSGILDSETAARAGDRLTACERFFQFSHAMWRKNVLSTMLKERKTQIHRLVAESMEREQELILGESDISRLLTLFDHWKACGDFRKVAPLALAVGARLEEWDLSAQSLELYEDALQMAFGGVEATDNETDRSEWVQVKAKPVVLDLILRLHVCIGLCHQKLGDEQESIYYFEDALSIIKSASKLSGISKTLRMPMISSLCVLKLEQDSQHTDRADLGRLIGEFVQEADSPIHIGRSLVLKAFYHAKFGDFQQALETTTQLSKNYDVAANTEDMIAEYGRDYAMFCFSESVQWFYLLGMPEEAEKRSCMVVEQYISLVDPYDTDYMMQLLFPVFQVLNLLDRPEDADELLKKYIINPFHDYNVQSDFWAPLFNPLAYLLEISIMERSGSRDDAVLEDLEEWVLDDSHGDYDIELKQKAYTIMGELCWRLVKFKAKGDSTRAVLVKKARELLVPVAHEDHDEHFQKKTAQALLDSL